MKKHTEMLVHVFTLLWEYDKPMKSLNFYSLILVNLKKDYSLV